MLHSVEERIYDAAFYRSSTLHASLSTAEHLLADARELRDSLRSANELQERFRAVDEKDSAAARYDAALLIVTACMYCRGRSWNIFGKPYTWNIVPRPQQIAAALELSRRDRGRFALQRTGEGKTITGLIAIGVMAVADPVHYVTANDYLAARDCQWIGPVLHLLGISTAILASADRKKHEAYGKRILFGSDKEFLFDYLRDSIRPVDERPFCERRDSILVDEGDHILLDELMTPAVLSVEQQGFNSEAPTADRIVRLIIGKQRDIVRSLLDTLSTGIAGDLSERDLATLTELRYAGPGNTSFDRYAMLHHREITASEQYEVRQLMAGRSYDQLLPHLLYMVDRYEMSSAFTENGMCFIEAETATALFTLPDRQRSAADHRQFNLLSALHNALDAHTVLTRDTDYIVRHSAVEVITRSIGRADPQKRFSQALSTAVALKEGLPPGGTSVTATRTFITAFAMEYTHRSAMSGTLTPDQSEFEQLYHARSFPVPPFRKLTAIHLPPRIFPDAVKKYTLLVDQVREAHSIGRPVLIGTCSISVSEAIARALAVYHISPVLLNAKNEHEEADIIADAGRFGRVTVATNMAGRGCDILVDAKTADQICSAFLERLLSEAQQREQITVRYESPQEFKCLSRMLDESALSISSHLQQRITVKGHGSKEPVSLHFGLGLDVHIAECCPSRRIENQFRGRTGRQGNPGRSSLYIALDDAALEMVPTVRWLGTLLFHMFGEENQFISRLLTPIISFATEEQQRHARHERFFHDGVTELIRKRCVSLRERACATDAHTLLSGSIQQCLQYITEETAAVPEDSEREAAVREIVSDIFCLSDREIPDTFFDDASVATSALRSWLCGLQTSRTSSVSVISIQALFCSLLDKMWSTFVSNLDHLQEQSRLFTFAGLDAKATFVRLTYTAWHQELYRLYQDFLSELFRQETGTTAGIKVPTGCSNDELDALFA